MACVFGGDLCMCSD